jgi:hypothetical protein
MVLRSFADGVALGDLELAVEEEVPEDDDDDSSAVDEEVVEVVEAVSLSDSVELEPLPPKRFFNMPGCDQYMIRDR